MSNNMNEPFLGPDSNSPINMQSNDDDLMNLPEMNKDDYKKMLNAGYNSNISNVVEEPEDAKM